MIDTPRLHIRPFTLQDASFILRLVNEPSWLEFIGDRHVHSLLDAENYLRNGAMKNYDELGFGFWNVILRETQTSVGVCGLTQRDYLDHPDLGFAFLPTYTGLGLAFEAAEAVVDFAFQKLHLSTLYAYVLPNNVRSIRLLEKLEFKHLRDFLQEENLLSLYCLQSNPSWMDTA